MIIEKIYQQIYTKMEQETQVDDEEISNQLSILAEQVKMDELTEEGLQQLLCQASLIGHRQGFVSGFRFITKLVIETIS